MVYKRFLYGVLVVFRVFSDKVGGVETQALRGRRIHQCVKRLSAEYMSAAGWLEGCEVVRSGLESAVLSREPVTYCRV